MQKNIKIFSDPQSVAKNFSEYFIQLASHKTKFNVALSGGSTPKIIFDYLAEKYPQASTWHNIHLYWGDERCVPPNDDDSNFKMTKQHLLDKIEIPSQNIHRIKGESIPQEESGRYALELSNNLPLKKEVPIFDLVILGMGDDGHTASIFPDQLELLESSNICEVATHPISGQKRITLTGRVINNAGEIIFLVTGGKKKEKVSEIIQETGNFKNYPANYVKPLNGKLGWYLDQAAAGLLT